MPAALVSSFRSKSRPAVACRYGTPVKGQVLGGRWKPLHYLFRRCFGISLCACLYCVATLSRDQAPVFIEPEHHCHHRRASTVQTCCEPMLLGTLVLCTTYVHHKRNQLQHGPCSTCPDWAVEVQENTSVTRIPAPNPRPCCRPVTAVMLSLLSGVEMPQFNKHSLCKMPHYVLLVCQLCHTLSFLLPQDRRLSTCSRPYTHSRHVYVFSAHSCRKHAVYFQSLRANAW